jgi:Uma2 family endonuclease
LLAVEVLSPSTIRTDRGEKRDLYQRKGVPEYWIVDVDSRAIERYRPDSAMPETLTEGMEWKPDRFVDPLAVDLRGYFARVLGPGG